VDTAAAALLTAVGGCVQPAADRIVYGIPDVVGALHPCYAGQTTRLVSRWASARREQCLLPTGR
jgi:hypothetical protein